jgi:DedD protein
MEARAKQRLTGAIILVALFVLLVPELLTGPRDSHPPAETQSDEGLRRYTIDLDARTGNAAVSPGTHQPAVALPTVPAASNSTLAAPGEAAMPESTIPVAPVPVVPTPANPSVTASAPNNVAAPAPAPAPSRAGAPPRTETARPSVTESGSMAPASSGGFAVQLGTFGKRENADRLVRDMTAKGFSAFVVPTNTNGHELFRVRVGPAHDRAAAEALATQLKRSGQSGSIVPIS